MTPSSPNKQREEGEIPTVETNTALIAAKKLCILSIVDRAMSMAIFHETNLEAASSSSETLRYGLGLAFLKEITHRLTHYFLVDLHNALLFYDEGIDWGEWEKKHDLGSCNKSNRLRADWVDRMFAQRQKKLKKLGIIGIILSSKSDIPFNQSLIFAFLVFWFPSSNCFLLLKGPMSITLADIYHILNIPLDGEVILPSFSDPS